MSEYCNSTHAGHHPHWVQLNLVRKSTDSPVRVSLLERRGEEVVVHLNDGVETWRVHQTAATGRFLTAWSRGDDAFLLGFGVLFNGHGYLYPCRSEADWKPCTVGEQPYRLRWWPWGKVDQ